jgi:hypothetical protein
LVSVTLCICFIIVAGFYFNGREDRILTVEVLDVHDEDGMGAVSTLSIKVTNGGSSSVQPAFSIMCSTTAYYWNVLEGPQLLRGRASAIYKIRAPIAQAIIANGQTFIVKVNDKQSSVFCASDPIEVDLEAPPPILNGGLKYWITDPSDKRQKPYMWQLVAIFGDGDSFSVSQETVGGRNALEAYVTQNGAKDKDFWAVGQVRQFIGLPTSSIGLWVYPTFTYKDGASPQNVFGVEINDGTHVIWFIFSDRGEGIYDLPNRRIIVAKAPLNEWSYHKINISEEYLKLGYQLPGNVMFSLIMGAGQNSPGTYTGYFSDIAPVP